MRSVAIWMTIGALSLGAYRIAEERGLDLVAVFAGENKTERAAIEIRCGSLPAPDVRACEERFAARIESGRIDPASVVRLHCTRIENVWIRRSAPEPPPVCTHHFGGWVTG